MQKVRKLAVIAKKGESEVKAVAERVVKLLLSNGLKVVTYPKLLNLDSVPRLSDLKEEDLDMLVTVGGDGTILSTSRTLDDEIPVLGINVGGRGVLAELKPKELESAVERIMKGSYYLERRLKISCSAPYKAFPPALNEVYLNRIPQTSTPTFTIKSDFKLRERMDGVIISTPTGSTGHGLSIGGPVAHESLEVLLLTPVGSLERLPHLVLPVRDIIISSNEPISLTVDGQEAYSIGSNVEILVRKHGKATFFVRFNDRGLRQLANLGFS